MQEADRSMVLIGFPLDRIINCPDCTSVSQAPSPRCRVLSVGHHHSFEPSLTASSTACPPLLSCSFPETRILPFTAFGSFTTAPVTIRGVWPLRIANVERTLPAEYVP